MVAIIGCDRDEAESRDSGREIAVRRGLDSTLNINRRKKIWKGGSHLTILIDRLHGGDYVTNLGWTTKLRNSSADLDLVLRRSPSWLKICQAQAFIPQTADMIPGMYFTREHFQRLREDPRLQGPRGTRFGYANVSNYLDNTMFNRLVETGFIGSTGSSTELLHDQIMLSFEGHKSLVVATLHGNEMPQSKQNTEKRQQLRSA